MDTKDVLHYYFTMNINNICRICLEKGVQSHKLTPIFDPVKPPHFSNLIMACASVQVSENDGLPALICTPCITKLNIAYDFKTRAEDSDAKLREFFLDRTVLGSSMPCSTQHDITQISSNVCLQTEQLPVKREINKLISNIESANSNSVQEIISTPENCMHQQILTETSNCLETNFSQNQQIPALDNCTLSQESSVNLLGVTSLASNHNLINSIVDITALHHTNGIIELKDLQNITESNRLITVTPLQNITTSIANASEQLENNVCMEQNSNIQLNIIDASSENSNIAIESLTNNTLVNLTPVSTNSNLQEIRLELKKEEPILEFDLNSSSQNREVNLGKILTPTVPKYDNENNIENDNLDDRIEVKFVNSTFNQTGEVLSSETKSKNNKIIKKHNSKRRTKAVKSDSVISDIKDEDELSDDEIKCENGEMLDGKDFKQNGKNSIYHQCDTCGKIFRTKQGLIQHIRIHTGEKPYLCHLCNKRFINGGHLHTHMRTHTGEKNHRCQYCTKAFATAQQLHKHTIAIHTLERPYQCSYCPKRCASSSNLTTHIRIHTGEKNYHCDRCPKAFSTKGQLLQHILVHTGEKPFLCECCNKRFTQRAHLTRHSKMHR